MAFKFVATGSSPLHSRHNLCAQVARWVLAPLEDALPNRDGAAIAVPNQNAPEMMFQHQSTIAAFLEPETLKLVPLEPLLAPIAMWMFLCRTT